MVVCIACAIRRCNVMQTTSATNLLVIVVMATEVPPIHWMQQVRLVPQFNLWIIAAQIEGGGERTIVTIRSISS